MKRLIAVILLSVAALASRTFAADANRLAYLNAPCDPYYVTLESPKLTTPQWVGEEGVDAVVVLAIDDMKDTAKYEAFLRPILNRLKEIDGRAPVSIMTCSVDPADPRLRAWLGEGLSIEPHTWRHRCPCLQKGDLSASKRSVDFSLDLMAAIPGNRPVGFRMPCCDSLSTVSPRFFTEIFGKRTPGGRFLRLDTSVFQVFTSDDPLLPRGIVQDKGGREKFAKYIAKDNAMSNYIENYPYPYVVDRLAWEIPCLMPSDWCGQHFQKENDSPKVLADWKAGLDALVLKKGTIALCFHPHGWISAKSMVEFIDHARSEYGDRVKFLTLREVEERLTEHLTGGVPLRADDGSDNGVRIADLDGDGFMDVLIGNAQTRRTRLWLAESSTWTEMELPVAIVERGGGSATRDAGARFGVVAADGGAAILAVTRNQSGLWRFDVEKKTWVELPESLTGLECDGPVLTADNGRDLGVRLYDVGGDGICEVIVRNPSQNAVFALDSGGWKRQSFALPPKARIVDDLGRDGGARFWDVDADGRPDVVYSNPEGYGVYAYDSAASGWSRAILDRARGDAEPGETEIPPFVRDDGTNNGAWFKYGHLFLQNEDNDGQRENALVRIPMTAILGAGRRPSDTAREASIRSVGTSSGDSRVTSE